MGIPERRAEAGLLPSDWLALTATRVINPCPKGTPRPRRSRTGRQYGYQVAASCAERSSCKETAISQDRSLFGDNPGAASRPLALATNCDGRSSFRMLSSVKHFQRGALFAQLQICEWQESPAQRFDARLELRWRVRESSASLGQFPSGGENSRANSRTRRKSSLPVPRCGNSSTAKN